MSVICIHLSVFIYLAVYFGIIILLNSYILFVTSLQRQPDFCLKWSQHLVEHYESFYSPGNFSYADNSKLEM